MRNLKNVLYERWASPAEFQLGGKLTATAWDTANDAVLCTYGPTEESPVIELVRTKIEAGVRNHTTITSWDAPCPNPDLSHDQILSLQFFADTLTACLVLAGGDIVVVREEPEPGEDRIEIVGSIDAGITAARWSPDEELLAITTKADTVVFMSRTFEGITDVTMTPDDLKASNHVSVGWGKKETQFQGKGAKALKDPTMPEKFDEGVLSPNDDSSVTITWRGDGAFLAISSIEGGSRRLIRVYSREGVLDSVSEPVDGLEGALSWRPAGNLMAGIQRFPDRVDVVFFERNGLRHGQFSLRLTPEELASFGKNIKLCWNPDSTVLAVIFEDRIQLWTMGNYHWYLKQEIIARGPAIGPTPLVWHPENPLQSLFATAASIIFLEYSFTVAHGSLAPPNDFGTVAVIDGQNLKVTPFRTANVPPPMAHYEIDLPANATDVLFLEGSSVAVLHHKGISVYNWEDQSWIRDIAVEDEKKESLQQLSLDLILGSEAPPSSGLQFRLSRNGGLFANKRQLVKNCTSFLVTPAHLIFTTTNHLLKFVHLTDDPEKLSVPPDDPEKDERVRNIERGARLVTAMPSKLSLILQMPRGNLETIFPRAMVVAGIRHLIEEKNYKKAFAHCRTQRVDMNILCDHCPEQFMENVGEFIKQVKKVSYIDLFLSSLRDEDVTQTMYKNTKPSSAKSNGVPIPNDTSLANGTATPKNTSLDSPNGSKVNRICDTFLAVLGTSAFSSTHLQNLITAHVSKNPPALEDGLRAVSSLVPSDSSSLSSESEVADKAVEHICFLADVNRLYDTALGLYDLPLTLLIAQQSQKDPREYLPFLQSLQQMSPLRCHYTIDDYLSRHAKALTSLHSLDEDFSEITTYVKRHNLYKEALGLYRYNPSRLSEITLLYAQYLEQNSKYAEAGLAYESIQHFDSATSCYQSASLWREALYSASQQTPPLAADALRDLASNLAEALYESKNYFDSATIHREYLDDLESACRVLCKGYHFADALRLIGLHISQKDKLLEIVDAGLLDALSSTTTLLSEMSSQLLAQVPRILELRQKAAEDPLAFYGGQTAAENEGDADLPDDLSVAASSRISTSASLFTRYTNKQSEGTKASNVSRATSKNRRREERKRARGKKGSVYEEEYLVASVGRLCGRVESVREEVGRLVEGLVRRGMVERARNVEGLMGGVVERCGEAVGKVWGVEEEVVVVKEEEGDGYGRDEEYRPGGADAVLAESLEARAKGMGKKPTVGTFERLSLLGS